MSRRSWGSVRKTPSGRWQPRFTAPDGTLRTLGKTFPTKREAESALNIVRVEIDRGVWVDPKNPGPSAPNQDVTLSAYIPHFHLSRVGKRGGPVRPNTRKQSEQQLRTYILPTFGKRPLASVTLADVREWYGRLQDPAYTPHPWKKDAAGNPAPLSTSLLRQCYALLKAILNMALQEELIATNPCRIRGAGQNRYAPPEYMTLAAAGSIIDHLAGDVAVMAKIALATGCRQGELLALTWGNVNLSAAVLDIRRSVAEVDGKQQFSSTKTDETRTIDLDPATVALLRTHKATRSSERDDRLFLSGSGTPLRHRDVQKAWVKARAAVGLPFKFHHLRHTHLTVLAYHGWPIQEIMHRAGHASFVAAMNYQRLAKGVGRLDGSTAPAWASRSQSAAA